MQEPRPNVLDTSVLVGNSCIQGTRRTKRERRFLGDFTGDLAEMGDPAENSRKWGPLSPLRELTEGQWKAAQRQLR